MRRPLIVVAVVFCALSLHAQFSILEMPATKKIDLKGVTNPDVAVLLTFVGRGAAKTQVTLSCTRFVNEAGDQFEPELKDELGNALTQIKLDPLAEKRIFVKATLAPAGTYNAFLRTRIKVKKKPVEELYTISVTRTVVAPPFTIAAIPPKQATVRRSNGLLTETLETQIYTSSNEIMLVAPVLIAPTIKRKTDSPAGMDAPLKFIPDQPTLLVKPGSPATLKGTVTGIDRPGAYEGTLRFAPAGYVPQDVKFTVYVRRSALTAFLWIFLGVLLSLIVHAYATSIRPRLLVQQRVASLRQQLAAASEAARGDAEAQAIIAGISKAMETKWEAARERRRPITTELDVYDTIVPAVPLWVAMNAQLRGVKPRSVAIALKPTVDAARNAFLANTPDATTVQSSIGELRKLSETIRTEIGTALESEVKALRQKLSNDGRPEIVAILNALDVVSDLVKRKQIEKAVGAFETALWRYIRMSENDLRTRITAPQPVGIGEADWQRVKDETQPALDQVAAASDVEDAMFYLRRAANAYVRTFAAAISRSAATELDETQRAAVEKELEPIETAIEDADLQKAWTALDKAQKAFTGAMNAAGQPMGVLLAEAAGGSGLDIPTIIDVSPPWSSLADPGSGARAGRAITGLDIFISFMVLLAAAAFGLQSLWTDNPTWGGWESCLAAFLLGFGLDQFTHAGVRVLGSGGR